jgi:hypothetical protein
MILMSFSVGIRFDNELSEPIGGALKVARRPVIRPAQFATQRQIHKAWFAAGSVLRKSCASCRRGSRPRGTRVRAQWAQGGFVAEIDTEPVVAVGRTCR